MYSKETMVHYGARLRTLCEELERAPLESLHACISTGNRKIGRALNVSLAPIVTCANCSGCSRLCYDIKACLAYPSAFAARARNTVLLRRDRARYFDEIETRIQRRRGPRLFRWHVAGDIVDIDYFARMVEIARRHPDFRFWTYTKNYPVVNQYVREHGGTRRRAIPANLSIMFSEWRGMEMLNPYHFPEFRVVFKGEKAPRGHYCPGNCELCTAAGRGCPAGETTYCHEH